MKSKSQAIVALLFVIGLSISATASAGLFDDLKKRAKETADKIKQSTGQSAQSSKQDVKDAGNETKSDVEAQVMEAPDKAMSTTAQQVDGATQQAADGVSSTTDAAKQSVTGSTEAKSTNTAQTGNPSPKGNAYDQAAANNMQWWPESPPASVTVRDTEIKGIKLGMLVSEAAAALEKQGFERHTYGHYVLDVVSDHGTVKKVAPSQNTSNTDSDVILLQKHTIAFTAVKPSVEMLAELYPDLPPAATQASSGNAQAAAARVSRTTATTDRAQRATGGTSANPDYERNRELIYKISYTQYFTKQQQIDQKVLMQQVKKRFGPPNYAPASVHARAGAAFDTNEYNSLWYLDSTKVSNKHKQQLLDQADPASGSLFALKQSFVHPCNPPKCASTDVGKPYPDKLDLQLDAARVMYAANMGVLFQGSKLVIEMAWPYLQADGTVREYFAQKQQVKSLPKAKIDF